MALFFECMLQCAQKVLDAADIVRDGDLSSTTRSTAHESRKSAIASRTFCSDCFHFQQGPRVQSPLTDLRWALLAVGAIPDVNSDVRRLINQPRSTASAVVSICRAASLMLNDVGHFCGFAETLGLLTKALLSKTGSLIRLFGFPERGLVARYS